MIDWHWLIAIALTAQQADAPPESPPETTAKAVRLDAPDIANAPAGELTETQADAIRSKCGPRRFETSAEGLIGGQMKRRRMTLCAAPGDSDAQWIAKLENAVAWVRLQTDLADDVKDQLIADLRAKIDEVKSIAAVAKPPVAQPMAPPLPVRQVPAEAPAQAAARPAPVRPPQAQSLMASKPRLTLLCASRGNPRSAPCSTLSSDTIIIAQAADEIAGGMRLRFLRRGEDNVGEVALSGLRRGQEARVKLPSRVCRGVFRSKVTIQAVTRDPAAASREQVAESFGPFELRC